MKTIDLSPKQKKWALTATLLAVLGFNLSAPFHQGMQSMDLASESGEEESTSKTQTLITSNGQSEVRVEYRREGEKTLALVHGSLEGGACEASGCLSAQLLNVPFESSATELERALRNQMTQVGQRPTPPRDNAEEEEYVEEEVDRSQAALDRLVRVCERKDDGQEKASCLTREFIRALKRSSPKIDKDLALDFFRDEIHPHLLLSLTSEDMESITMGTAMLGGRELSIRGGEILRKLQAEIPREYSDIRKAAKDVAVEVINHYSAIAKNASERASQSRSQAQTYGQMADQAMQQANQTQNPDERMRLMQQANQYRSLQHNLTQQAMQQSGAGTSSMGQLENILVKGLYQEQYAGLREAYAAKQVDQGFANQLLNDYQAQAAQAMTSPTLPNIVITPGNPSPGQPSVPGQGQQIGVGNGMGTITGGSLGRSPVINPNQQFQGGGQSFTGAPLAPPAGSPFMQRQYDPSLMRQ